MKHGKRSFKGFKLGLYTDGEKTASVIRVRYYKKSKYLEIGFYVLQSEGKPYYDFDYEELDLEYKWLPVNVFKKCYPDRVDKIIIEQQ